MHGDGYRATNIAEQIVGWNPDIVALAEFRDTQPSRSIAESLRSAGFVHQLSTVNAAETTCNALLLASRFELDSVRLKAAPEPRYLWLHAKVEIGSSLSYRGHARPAWRAMAQPFGFNCECGSSRKTEPRRHHQRYKLRPYRPGRRHGVFRRLQKSFRGAAVAAWLARHVPRLPTWLSHIRFGFRLDHAYVHSALQPCVTSCAYDRGRAWNDKQLSDHAAILLDLKLPN